MKLNLLILLVSSLISGIAQADCMPSAQVANQFVNDYTAYTNKVFKRKTKETAAHWLNKNKLLSDDFKKSYQKLVADPESGLDFDPIFNAQDYPDKGFKIVTCDEASGLVTLAAKDKGWEKFKVIVKVLNTKAGWRVDGAGVINIPKDRQIAH